MQGTRKGRMTKAMLILLGILAVIALAYYSGVGEYMSLASLQKKSASIRVFVEQDYMRAVLYYVCAYVVLIMLTLPVVGPLTMLGGYLFGLLFGFLYALAAACFGSLCSFLCMRYLLSSLIKHRYKVKLERFNEKIKMYGYSYLLTLQLLSVVPYVVINALAALTDVPLKAFMWTTIVGSMPLIFIYALAGQQLGKISTVGDIFSPHIIMLLVLMALLALVPMVLKKFKHYDV